MNRSMAKFLFLSGIFIMLLTNCKKLGLCNDDELSIDRQNYEGEELKINGYYYEESSSEYPELYFFYKNGIVISACGAGREDVINGNITISSTGVDTKSGLGVFNVNNDTLELEYWTPTSYGCFRTMYLKCEILNDRTLAILRKESREDGETVSVDNSIVTCYFVSFDAKPDSTNNYIE